MEFLGDLFNKYGSDKDRNGYTPYYDSLFKNLRSKPVSLLEIGIGTMIPEAYSSMVGYSLPGYRPGGSLRAWRDYFANGTIVGMDVQPDTQFTEERITTHLVDSTNREAIDAALGASTFDVILDDGSHYDEHQFAGLRHMWHRVRAGGYYIIEDLQPWNRLHGEFRPLVKEFVGNDATLFFSEAKNILILSKIIR